MQIGPNCLELFYDGLLHGWGHLVDHRGGGERRLSATFRGDWDGTVLTLDQSWEPEGSSPERRLWRIRPTEAGYVGTAADVVGQAEAKWKDGRLRWNYLADVAVGGQAWRLACEETWQPQTANVATVEVRVSKFGLLIAEIHLILSRDKPNAPA